MCDPGNWFNISENGTHRTTPVYKNMTVYNADENSCKSINLKVEFMKRENGEKPNML